MFPIKYIENNLVFNHDGECFAYYELITPQNKTEKTEESRAGPPLSLYIDNRIFLAAACSMSCSASALLPRSADTMI